MRIAFVVRDELMPVRNGYHSTGINLLRQLAGLCEVRCVYLGAKASQKSATAAWCAERGITYEAICIPDLPHLDGSLGMIGSLMRAAKRDLRQRVVTSLQSIGLGQNGERVVVFTAGWDAISDVVAGMTRNPVCFPADSITLFEKARLLSGARALLRSARVAFASTREKAMLRAGYARVVYVAARDAELARSLVPASPERVVIVPIGINPEEFDGAQPMTERVAENGELLLFSGTLVFLPNRDAATRLVSQILPRIDHQSARVRLVGSGGEVLAALAGPRVEIAGWVPSLIDELKRATLFVAPVRMGGGAKNNVLQALAAGTPVVGTPPCFAGFDGIPPGGVVCDTDDDFVRAIQALLSEPQRLAKLSADARAFALAECTWQVSAARLIAQVKESA